MGQCASRGSNGRERRADDSQRRGGGCMAMVKQQRSRWYIARRCIMMLLCWHNILHYHWHLHEMRYPPIGTTRQTNGHVCVRCGPDLLGLMGSSHVIWD
ncbi:protein rotundifolia like 6 [Tripterygium wilfordii]|uniref:Protein rotundifolia like 6 n=1 Tax=Tripterygium wilfordii TaxID=458696 RepID=A0A7J7CPB4_TRIWF|nr:protein rotundifolia like 6 [Tripterygium wilfordii]